MSDQARLPKRIILSDKPQVNRANITALANVDALLDDALGILEGELIALKVKSRNGERLKLAESRVLIGYVKSLVELSKEQRERDAQQNFGDMTDEQLLEHFKAKIEQKKLAGA